MRIAAYRFNNQRQVGIVSADGQQITPLALNAEQAHKRALALIELQAEGRPLPEAGGPALAVSAVRLEAPLPVLRRNVWYVGRNYPAHAKERQVLVCKDNDANLDSWPIVFTKVPECVVGPFDVDLVPVGVSDDIDYEAELAVDIGKRGKNIAKADALGHVFGYTIVNDVTARDVQMRHQQWDMGKSFDNFCPMGPWLVTADELEGIKTRWATSASSKSRPTRCARCTSAASASCPAATTASPGCRTAPTRTTFSTSSTRSA